MSSQVLRSVGAWLAARGILLLLVATVGAVATIGVVGMTASVLVAERVQGSGSAINVAGSLRRLAHRAGAMVVGARLDGQVGEAEVVAALEQFDQTLVHPALLAVLGREESAMPEAIYRGVVANWREQLRPRLLELGTTGATDAAAIHYGDALARVDGFVEQINTLVAVLEHDAEASIGRLRTTLAAALAMTALVVLASLFVLRRRVFAPLSELRAAAGRIARRDFVSHHAPEGADELGQVGSAFNAMAGELSLAYGELEARVARKTADLTRSNQSLELLYNVISRLYHAPASPAAYAETLAEIEHTLGLKGSFACVQPKHGGPSAILFSSMAECGRSPTHDDDACMHCLGTPDPWRYQSLGGYDVLVLPLRDADHAYGMLRFSLAPGQRLESWQHHLLEAVSRHMGVALGITRQTERERLLALQQERSIIARELHDSLAQALTFMKIQVSLLGPALADPQRRAEAETMLTDLREAINSAYRQLRELLSSFRLQMDGDFSRLLSATTEEFASRSGLPVTLTVQMGQTALAPNQEIHVLHIVREALSNATRHAEAAHVAVRIASTPKGEIDVEIEDDGKGFDPGASAPLHHYGLSIMSERARGLGGRLMIAPRAQGGTRVAVRFDPRRAEPGIPIQTTLLSA